ncbi:MAG: hypothetical protein PHX38_09930 [Sulfuricella sp.]|nr:hypothetical protein [Sulfuricella sp.]
MRAVFPLLLCLCWSLQAYAAEPYTEIAIVQPGDDETIHDNNGTLEVALALSPALRDGHKIRLLLDGAQLETRASAHFSLTNIERGTHSLQAVVIDRSGRTLIASAPVAFHMWRASALFPGRQKPKP